MNVIEINNLKKSFEDFTLSIDHLALEKGTITGLVGENGSGKTTLLKCILEIYKHEGDILIFGEKLNQELKNELSFVFEDMFISEILNATDLGKIFKNIYKNWDAECYDSLLAKFKLPLKKDIRKFSKGMKMQFKIICALSAKPRLLILDEPTSGLDPVVRDDILNLLLDFMVDEEMSILFSSHITTDLEKIADQIILLHDGKVLLYEEKPRLLEEYGILKGSKEQFERLEKGEVLRYRELPYSVEALVQDKFALRKKYPDMVVDGVTLDDVMIFLIKGGSR